MLIVIKYVFIFIFIYEQQSIGGYGIPAISTLSLFSDDFMMHFSYG